MGLKVMSKRGFTLIELLVVIAIIGILSAVVLASLNTARNKGSDAAIQSDLSTIQTEAEIYYGGTGNNSYGANVANGSCTAAGTMFATSGATSDAIMVRAISATETVNGSGTGMVCGVCAGGICGAIAYAIQSQLVNDTTKYWCVDSAGNAKQESSGSQLGNGVYVCP
jgi:prepilin-type N-terminal cleavage/methylation domain-containing protein